MSKNEKKSEEAAKDENKRASEDVKEAEKTESTAEKAETAEEKQEEKPKTPEERIAELEAQIEEMKKEALYKMAENDNWRKRMMQQKEEAVSYANANLLGDILDSLDNLDRTVEAAKNNEAAKAIVEGVQMVSKSLMSMLENKYNLSGFGEAGDEFDPDLHEAIGMQEGDVEKEQLAAVYLKGYKLKDKVIRHAKVMVLKPKA